uniref:aspartate transaminase n=1 Tax=Timema cristinae TaxID=61476 RepID=A0A7R9CNF7_TIMCR|nr:unnamed protein product [Timema cristinae]
MDWGTMGNRRFQQVNLAPKPESQLLREEYEDDHCDDKIDLALSVYRTEEGEPWVPNVIRRVEKMMAMDPSLDHEYHWFSGLEPLTTVVTGLLLGAESRHVRENKVVTFQSVGGTGALRIGAQFLSKEMGYDTFCVSSPSRGDHEIVFRMAGFTTVLNYRYWSDVTKSLDITGLLEDLSKAPENAVVVLQPSAHNPTGCDPSREQWARIADVMQEKKLFPFFEVPYQGFASGDLDDDIWPVRFFADRGLEFMVAYSLALSTALYNERVGALAVVLNDSLDVEAVRTRLQVTVRAMYCSPPAHGAVIAIRTLSDPVNFQEW